MKTLAQLKRDIAPGMTLEIIEIMEAPIVEWSNNSREVSHIYGPLEAVEIKEKIAGPRKVTKVDTTGFYLSKDETRGSFCEWPKAAELEYTDNTFTVSETDQHGKVYQTRNYTIND